MDSNERTGMGGTSETASDATTAATDGPFFEGFEERFVDVPDGRIFCRIKGSGEPLLLLHGYPQTSAMWHRVAPRLAGTYQVICADLRGYGRSMKPESDTSHRAYSKRETAKDMVAVMAALGHTRFRIGSHDRGSRVAHRLAADHPEAVIALATLDIAPTREMYRDGGDAFARTYWHWYWLIQAAPFPETLIGADPDYYWRFKCDPAPAGLGIFDQRALDEYLTAFRDPAAIHASCEDYRAAVTCDFDDDNADDREGGGNAKIAMPLLALWGAGGAIEKHFDCLKLWRERASDVRGKALAGGHYLAEECPDAVLAEWVPFFAQD